MMDILIQQDGRIQTNIRINPDKPWFHTVEVPPLDGRVGWQMGAADFPLREMPLIKRTFRKVYSDSNITVWVEHRMATMARRKNAALNVPRGLGPDLQTEAQASEVATGDP